MQFEINLRNELIRIGLINQRLEGLTKWLIFYVFSKIRPNMAFEKEVRN